MIPKIIHYCWLSDEPYPELIETCIKSWKKALPDYEIRKWDMNSFDINSVKFVKEACEKRKWAFAADYIRLYALYHNGGIYLDSDVFVKKSFDTFLQNDFFSSIEYSDTFFNDALSSGLVNSDGMVSDQKTIRIPGLAIQAAVLGSIKGNEYIGECLAYYEDRPFILENGELNNKNLLPDTMAFVARKYGFKYLNKEQFLDKRLMLYPSSYFAGFPKQETDVTYAIHCCSGSWRKKHPVRKLIDNIKEFLFVKKQQIKV